MRQTISTKGKKRIIASTILNGYHRTNMSGFNEDNAVLDRRGGNMSNHDYRIRKLTPKECWRLMDFTDDDFEKAAAVNSNTQLYKQAGNSIVVNVLVAILGQLFEGTEYYYRFK